MDGITKTIQTKLGTIMYKECEYMTAFGCPARDYAKNTYATGDDGRGRSTDVQENVLPGMRRSMRISLRKVSSSERRKT